MIIALGATKGGVGKSTIVTNLAVAFQQRRKQVIVVEADPTVRTLSTWKEDRATTEHPPVTVVRQAGNLRDDLRDLDGKYDIVLVDLPGKDSREMRTTATVADLLLIPCQPHQVDIDPTIAMLPIIEEARDFNPGLIVSVVLNRVPTHAWSTKEEDARAVLEESFGLVVRTSIHDRTVFSTANGIGLSVLEANDKKAQHEITALTDDIERMLTND